MTPSAPPSSHGGYRIRPQPVIDMATNTNTTSGVIYHGPAPDYCDGCYSAAREAGREVRKVGGHQYCGLCESRARNGLVHYSPSNGTEGDYFFSRCSRCRHYLDDGYQFPSIEKPHKVCAWGVGDRVMLQMFESHDHACNWFDPEDLSRYDAAGRLLSPARCLRFTDKRDGDGEHRDPPRPDVEGQMVFGDLLTVPEVVPVKVTVKGVAL